jgi:hypothetical protein
VGNFLITDNKVSLVPCSKRRIALLARAGAEFALISGVRGFSYPADENVLWFL